MVGICQSRNFHTEIGTGNRFYGMKNKKMKNPIDRIHLYLLLYELHEEIQKYLALGKGAVFYGDNQADVFIGS